jgi:predicted Zn-dependent protease
MVMLRRGRRVILGLVGVVCVALVLSCTVNTATGQRQLTLMSEAQEIQMGQQSHESVIASFGLYPDDELQNYIQRLGAELAATSERPDLPWSFAVVDDPLVNAFALPGGYIYVTRGILAHFNSEAELASVLGHEIGHVTARHSVEQMSQQQLAGLGIGIAAAVSEELGQYAAMASQGLQLLFLKFSRDDERQSDDLGLRYMTRAGYDPNEMPPVFHTLDRVSAAQGGGRIPVWASTHPNPDNRASRIERQIEGLPAASRTGTVNRTSYLERLDGLVFGDNPREGYTIDSTYYHPELEFALDFPDGWRVINQRQAVAGISPDQDAIVVLTMVQARSAAAAETDFFSQEGIARGSSWRQGFTHFWTVATPQDPQTVRGGVGFFEHGGRVYRLLGFTSSDRWDSFVGPIQASLDSFRRISDRRYLDVQPARLELVELDRAMTLSEFDQRYPSSVELSALAIANGVEADDRLEAGRLVKRVVGGELPEN